MEKEMEVQLRQEFTGRVTSIEVSDFQSTGCQEGMKELERKQKILEELL